MTEMSGVRLVDRVDSIVILVVVQIVIQAATAVLRYLSQSRKVFLKYFHSCAYKHRLLTVSL